MKTNIGMRSIEALCWAFFACCTIGIARHLVLDVLSWLEWGEPDWGTWIGAIGTVGTLIGTIYLANSQERQRQRDSRTTAQLFAAKLEGDVHRAISVLRQNKNEIVASLKDSAEFDGAEIAERLRKIRVWETQEIAHLVPLPEGVAIRLTEAQKNIEVVIEDSRRFDYPSVPVSKADVEALKDILASHEYMLFMYGLIHGQCLAAKQALHFAAEGIQAK